MSSVPQLKAPPLVPFDRERVAHERGGPGRQPRVGVQEHQRVASSPPPPPRSSESARPRGASITRAPAALAAWRVPSVLPPSTTITSLAPPSRALLTAAPMRAASSSAGTTTDTDAGRRALAFALRVPAREVLGTVHVRQPLGDGDPQRGGLGTPQRVREHRAPAPPDAVEQGRKRAGRRVGADAQEPVAAVVGGADDHIVRREVAAARPARASRAPPGSRSPRPRRREPRTRRRRTAPPAAGLPRSPSGLRHEARPVAEPFPDGVPRAALHVYLEARLPDRMQRPHARDAMGGQLPVQRCRAFGAQNAGARRVFTRRAWGSVAMTATTGRSPRARVTARP